MTATTDTQSLSGDALAQILGPTLAERKEAYAQPKASTETPEAPPVAQPPAEPAPVAASEQKTEPAPVVNSSGNSQPTDPYATLLNDVLGEQKPVAIQWSDEARSR